MNYIKFGRIIILMVAMFVYLCSPIIIAREQGASIMQANSGETSKNNTTYVSPTPPNPAKMSEEFFEAQKIVYTAIIAAIIVICIIIIIILKKLKII